MSTKITATIKIYNIPEAQFDKVFKEGLNMLGLNELSDTRDIVLDYEKIPINVFMEIMATSMAAYCAKEKIKYT